MKYKHIIFIIISMMIISACSVKKNIPSNDTHAQQHESTSEATINSASVINLDDEPQNQSAPTIEMIDFGDSNWLNYASCGYNNDVRKWGLLSTDEVTKNHWGETVEKNTLVLKNLGQNGAAVPEGLNPISIKIGNSEWYYSTFSFDFLLNDSELLEFNVFCDSSLYVCDIDKTGQNMQYVPFNFSIDKEGLAFNPIIGIDGHYVNASDGKNILAGIDYSIWNNIKIVLVDNDLHLILNGEEKGVIWTYDNTPHGAIGFGGGEGLMIKNIQIAE